MPQSGEVLVLCVAEHAPCTIVATIELKEMIFLFCIKSRNSVKPSGFQQQKNIVEGVEPSNKFVI
jgi:hypothetical protein